MKNIAITTKLNVIMYCNDRNKVCERVEFPSALIDFREDMGVE